MSERIERDAPAGPALRFWLPLAVAVAVAICFLPALDGQFLYWDDDATLVHNEHFRGISAESLEWMFTHPYGGPYAPLSWLSYAIDFELWGLDEGFSPAQAKHYHGTAIFLHALAALCFCGLARRAFAAAGADPSARSTWLASAFAALLFAAHPLRVESVAWVTERRDVLSGLLFILAVSAYLRAVPLWGSTRAVTRLRAGPASLAILFGAGAAGLFFGAVELGPERMSYGPLGLAGLIGAFLALAASTLSAHRATHSTADPDRRGQWFALALFWLLAAFCSKALGVVLPLVLLVLDLWPLRRWRSGDGLKPALGLAAEKAPFFALSLIFGVIAVWGQGTANDAMLSVESYPLDRRLAQAVYGLWFYPSKTVLPLGLVPLVEIPPAAWIRSAGFILPAIGVGLAALTTLALRKRVPALAVALLTFALFIAPVLGLSQAGAQLVADRYSYLPCMPLALLLAGGWLALARRVGTPAATLPALLAVIALGALTWKQTGYWRDNETLWNRNLEVMPEAAQPHYLLGVVHYRRGQEDADQRLTEFQLARRRFETGISRGAGLQPYYHGIYGALLIDLRDYRGAEAILEQVVAAAPDAINTTNLGLAQRLNGKLRQALATGESAVALDPDYTKGWIQLATTRESIGDRKGAVRALEEVLQDWPRYGPAKRKLRELTP